MHTDTHTHRSMCLVRLSVCHPSEARLPPWCQWEGRVRQSELRVRSNASNLCCVSNTNTQYNNNCRLIDQTFTQCALQCCVHWQKREDDSDSEWRRSEDVWCVPSCVRWSGPRTTFYTWAGRIRVVTWRVIGSGCSKTAGSTSGQAEETDRRCSLQWDSAHTHTQRWILIP